MPLHHKTLQDGTPDPSVVEAQLRAFGNVEKIAAVVAERDRLREALERIAALPNIPHRGEADGHSTACRKIAQDALGTATGPECPLCGEPEQHRWLCKVADCPFEEMGG